MYIAGLEKIMKAGQGLGLTGEELRNYFDSEREKLKVELALNREARRLGVDVVVLRQSGLPKEEVARQYEQNKDEEEREALKEYEKKKDEDERRIAALKKQIAALESRRCLVHPHNVPLPSVHVPGSQPSHPVPVQRELDLQAPDTNDIKAECPEEDKAPGSIILEAYSNNGPEVNIPKGLAAASETFSRSQKRPQKRKLHRKTAMHPAIETSVCTWRCRRSRKRQCLLSFNHFETRRLQILSRKNSHVMRQAKIVLRGLLLRKNGFLCSCYAGRLTAFRLTQRSGTPRKTTSLKHPRKRIKIRRKRRKKPRFRKKRDILTTWQYSPVPTGLTIHTHSTKRRRNGNHGVFHSRGSCCPTRKRRRVV